MQAEALCRSRGQNGSDHVNGINSTVTRVQRPTVASESADDQVPVAEAEAIYHTWNSFQTGVLYSTSSTMSSDKP